MGLRRFLKKVRKGLKLPAITLKNVAPIAATALSGGAPLALAASVVRSRLKGAAIGATKQLIKSKADRAVVAKMGKLLPTIAAANSLSPAVAKPGGAPIRNGPKRRPRRRSNGKRSRRERTVSSGAAGTDIPSDARLAQLIKKSRTRRAPRNRGAARAATRAGPRRPPTGGKDFKALSKSWRAAGKPGRWIDWVKSH